MSFTRKDLHLIRLKENETAYRNKISTEITFIRNEVLRTNKEGNTFYLHKQHDYDFTFLNNIVLKLKELFPDSNIMLLEVDDKKTHEIDNKYISIDWELSSS